MSERTLNVELRNAFGKNEANRLREKGLVPAVLYSHGNTENINFPVKGFKNIFKGHISESVLLDLVITNKTEDSKHQAFVKDYALHPVTSEIMHVDFYKVHADEKIHTIVNIIVEGTPKGVKEGGVLEIHEREIEIECLPKDMPEHIIVDVSNVEIGGSIHVKDIKGVGESVKFLESGDRVIAAVVVPVVQEEGAAAEGAAAGEEKASEEAAKDSGKAKE